MYSIISIYKTQYFGFIDFQLNPSLMLSSSSSLLPRLFSTKINIKPLGSRVLIKLNEQGNDKIGNLYVPETAQKKTNKGTVLAVGPGSYVEGKLLPMNVKVGQTVLLPQFGGQTVKVDREEYTIIMEEDILGIFDE